MEKRLIIKAVPRTKGEIPHSEGGINFDPIKFERLDLGIGKRPRYVVVVRGEAGQKAIRRLALDSSFPEEMSGSPIVWLPPGCDVEIYEVEP